MKEKRANRSRLSAPETIKYNHVKTVVNFNVLLFDMVML